MTEIKIMQLRLENFKCHRLLELDLQGNSATIYGDNAAGKTSIYDALTWLLFGKDSAGNGEKNIDVKPLDSTGATDRHTITAVEAVLQVAGEIITLRRTYREVWSSKRGSSTETYDGNTSEYYVDGVPCKKSVFDSSIQEIVPEETFHLLTSVSYFAQNLHWQKRRAVLFDIAGALTDWEIMATDGRFFSLSHALGNMPLDDYRRKLTAEKKGFTGIKTDIPARISECRKTVEELETIHYEGIKVEIEALEQEAATVAAQIHSTGTEDAERQRSELAQLEQQLSRAKAQLCTCENAVAAHERSINDSRARWIAVNQESFVGGTCPICGRDLPVEQLRTAAEAFETAKRNRLQEIERTARARRKPGNRRRGVWRSSERRLRRKKNRPPPFERPLTMTETRLQIRL